jgi:hypothetical protein
MRTKKIHARFLPAASWRGFTGILQKYYTSDFQVPGQSNENLIPKPGFWIV